MVALNQALLETGLAFLANLDGLVNGTESFLNGRTPDAIHYHLPASLQVPPKNNTEMVSLMQGTFPGGLSSFKAEPVGGVEDGIVIDEQKRKIVIHATGNGVTSFGNYFQEYIFTLLTTEDGRQVKESWEFLDSDLAWKWQDIIS